MNRVRRSRIAVTFAASVPFGAVPAQEPPRPPLPKAPEYVLTHHEPVSIEKQSFAYRWLNVMQEAAGRDVDRQGARPTVLSRQMMIWAVAMYDAWAAYDDHAVGPRLGGSLRRPAAERTLANKNTAVSYAS
jgi:hypothetical protein